MSPARIARLALVCLVAAALAPVGALAHEPPFTMDFDRDLCTFTPWGNNPYFPLWPGYSLVLEGEEEDDGEILDVRVELNVTTDTEVVDGVRTRVFEEREYEDGELVEVSRNFLATCRETGDVWYFGEDVDDYEDGMIVGHGGAWRAGQNGALPGILMPGDPLIGARYQQELAPGVAEDRGEVIAKDETVTVPAGTFDHVVHINDTDALDDEGGEGDPKHYARGVGQITDEEIELIEIIPPPCMPGATTLCLQDGRFRVEVDWADDQGNGGPANAMQISDDTGELWFFNADNTELIVKVLNACDLASNRFWVFIGGLTNVEVDVVVTDTATDQVMPYGSPFGTPFEPILDTDAFATCP